MRVPGNRAEKEISHDKQANVRFSVCRSGDVSACVGGRAGSDAIAGADQRGDQGQPGDRRRRAREGSGSPSRFPRRRARRSDARSRARQCADFSAAAEPRRHDHEDARDLAAAALPGKARPARGRGGERRRVRRPGLPRDREPRGARRQGGVLRPGTRRPLDRNRRTQQAAGRAAACKSPRGAIRSGRVRRPIC